MNEIEALLRKSIPSGHYCYKVEEGQCTVCPFWSKEIGASEQESGFCSYLGKGDYEINREPRWWDCWAQVEGWTCKYGTALEVFGDSVSLLWDKVKECHENEE